MSAGPYASRQRRTAPAVVIGALCAILISPAALALSISDARVASMLGQRLDAEMTVIGDDSEPPHISVSNSAIGALKPDELQIELEASGQHTWLLHLRSLRPLREPALKFDVQVSQSGIRVQRVVTMLLDPPGSTPASPRLAEPAAPAVVPSPVEDDPGLPAANPTPVDDDGTSAAAAVRHKARRHASHRTAQAVAVAPTPAAITHDERHNGLRLSTRLSVTDPAMLDEIEADTAEPATADDGELASLPTLELSTALLPSVLESSHAAELPSPTDSVRPAGTGEIDMRIAAARAAGRDALFLESPLKVFALLCLLAGLLYGQAHRLRKQIVREHAADLERPATTIARAAMS